MNNNSNQETLKEKLKNKMEEAFETSVDSCDSGMGAVWCNYGDNSCALTKDEGYWCRVGQNGTTYEVFPSSYVYNY